MNKSPKYQIGDHIPGTNIVVRGLMTTSSGKHIYFWQIGADNSMVVSEDEIEAMIEILSKNHDDKSAVVSIAFGLAIRNILIK